MDCSDSDLSFDISLESNRTSTPSKQQKQQSIPDSSKANKSKATKSKAKKPSVLYKCTKCVKKPYVQEKAFRNHLRTHAIEEAAVVFPSEEDIKLYVHDLSLQTLAKVRTARVSSSVADLAIAYSQTLDNNFCNFAKEVCKLFLGGGALKSFILPSKMMVSLVTTCDTILSNQDVMPHVRALLLGDSTCDPTIINVFICQYFLNFTEVLLKHVSTRVCGSVHAHKKPFECDAEDRKSIHFVGGATLRVHHQRAWAFPTCKLWRKILQIIVQRMTENEHMEGCSDEDKEWTLTKSRGSLIFISNLYMEFLLLVAEVIYHTEDSQGNVLHGEVYKNVLNSQGARLTWDEIIGDALEEKESLYFLKQNLKTFCRTNGKGIAARRLNEIRERPECSMNMRHAVAPAPKLST